MKFKQLTCISFWFDLLVMLPLLISGLFLGWLTIEGISIQSRVDVMGEAEVLAILLYILIFLISVYLTFKSLLHYLSWFFFGWIEKLNGRNEGSFIFKVGNLKALKYVDKAYVSIDKIRCAYYPHTKFDVNTRLGEKTPVHKTRDKKWEEQELTFNVQKKVYKNAINSNSYVWLNIRVMKFFVFTRCFKVR